jgi:hypothetical protein
MMIAPLIQRASGPIRKATMRAISSGVASPVRSGTVPGRVALSIHCIRPGVTVPPGATAFTRTPPRQVVKCGLEAVVGKIPRRVALAVDGTDIDDRTALPGKARRERPDKERWRAQVDGIEPVPLRVPGLCDACVVEDGCRIDEKVCVTPLGCGQQCVASIMARQVERDDPCAIGTVDPHHLVAEIAQTLRHRPSDPRSSACHDAKAETWTVHERIPCVVRR